MPRVLLLLPTKTYRAEALLTAAQQLGVAVTVASEEASTMTGINPSGLLTLDFQDPARAASQAVAFARQHPIHAVIPVDEETAVLAASIAAALSLPYNSPESAEAARNKYRMRERLARGGVRVPNYYLSSVTGEERDSLAKLVQDIEVTFGHYPCVLKPLILSASRGVIRANNAREFVEALERISALLRAPDIARRGEEARKILVEDYVPGREVALEGLLTNGALQVLAIFDKPDPLEGPFFEETIYVTPSRLPKKVQEEMAVTTQQATRALGLVTGPIHAELRVNAAGVWMIEVAARSIGGRCARILRFGAGLSLEELVLRHALGLPIDSLERERRAAGVMMVPIPRAGVLQAVHGLEAAKQVTGVEDVQITHPLGRELVPLPEGAAYLGFIFAHGETPEFVEAVLRASHRRLEFDISPAA